MLEHLLTLTADEKEKAIRTAFSNVCATSDGMLMLVVILDTLFLFLPTQGEGEQACNNAAKEILGLCNTAIAARVYEAWKNVISPLKEKEEGE